MFKHIRRASLLLLFALAPLYTQAADQLNEPEVTIVHLDDKVVEEYRVNGFLYAVKITPKKGPAYFLVRAEGQDEDFYHSSKPRLRIPGWKILTW